MQDAFALLGRISDGHRRRSSHQVKITKANSSSLNRKKYRIALRRTERDFHFATPFGTSAHSEVNLVESNGDQVDWRGRRVQHEDRRVQKVSQRVPLVAADA